MVPQRVWRFEWSATTDQPKSASWKVKRFGVNIEILELSRGEKEPAHIESTPVHASRARLLLQFPWILIAVHCENLMIIRQVDSQKSGKLRRRARMVWLLTFKLSFPSSSKFSGLISLWMTPFEWQYFSALASWRTNLKQLINPEHPSFYTYLAAITSEILCPGCAWSTLNSSPRLA